MAESLATARHHSHNFLTHDGKTPQEISQIAKEQVKQYPTLQFYEGEAVKGKENRCRIYHNN